VAEQPAISFAWLLKSLRLEAGLTQEDLAEAAELSCRAVSDLERGVTLSARKETTRLLAEALGLTGTARAVFEAGARRHAPGLGALAEADSMGSGAIAAATRTLPRDVASFTGRDAEMAHLMEAISEAEDTGGVVRIHAIGGMAGVGKTTFAIHAAHQLTTRFPDGQIFLRLHAHTPGQRPVDPAEALANLLLTTGVAADQIAPTLEARMGLWRSHLAGKRLLLILDDAAGHDQVRPLLPGTAGSLVLITSRRHLTALDDVTAISLDTLPSDDSCTLLSRLAARPGMRAEDAEVSQITQLCGNLPLAIGMLARQLHHHPAWTAAGLAGELAAARDRLQLMHAENLSVAAAFDLSYQDLAEGQQRLFCLLGLYPGPSIEPSAAAALAGISLAAAREGLDDLYDHYLITELAHGRYRMHDLIREHARVMAAALDPAESDAAVGRLMDYYLNTCSAAGRHFNRGQARFGGSSVGIGELATRDQAATWLETERANLQAAVDYAALRESAVSVAIPIAIADFLRIHGHWVQALALHHTALVTARRIGDRHGQVVCLTNLGTIQRLNGDYAVAITRLTEAVELYRALGDRHGQAAALLSLGIVQRLAVDYRTAASTLTEALSHFEGTHDPLGRADTLNELGVVYRLTRNYNAATASHRQSLELNRHLGDRLGQADALRYLGRALQESGDYAAVADSYRQALKLYRELDERLGQAHALSYLGVAQHVSRDYSAAADTLAEALDLYRGLGHRLGRAEVHNNLGELLCMSEPDKARAHHERALSIAREIAALLEEARAFEGIGHIDIQDGRQAEGAAQLRQALEIYQRIGSPYSARVQQTLHYHKL
jgi:tetratricopeptide (TPR) repeat protein/transcriptional regulator with XRE-family HTH domain